jgi:hypothetical protein
MDTKETTVVCPCCESRLEVDVRTGTVVRWRRKGEVDETGKPVLRESDWLSANERVQKRLGTAQDRFDAGVSRERSREKDLDDLFRKASEKLDKKPED